MTTKQRRLIIQDIGDLAKDYECSVTLLGDKDNQEDYAAAIIGTVECKGGFRVAYIASKVIKELMRTNTWKYAEALEWYNYNTVRMVKYMSLKDNPPILVDDLVM